MKHVALLEEFYQRPLASSPDEHKKSNFNYIFRLYVWIISVHKLLWLGETCVNYAAQKSC